MKKYKHKATGKTCTEKDTFYYIDSEGNLPKWVVENSNDWEELIEKEYEILSFKGTLESNSKGLFIRKDNKFYYKGGNVDWLQIGISGLSEQSMFSKSTVIHSIKRLSDGEVFTVGDRVHIGGEDRILNSFKLVDSILYIITNNGKDFWGHINDWQKSKQPLFVTEDGKGAFEGDKMFYVDIDETEYPYSWTPTQTTINKKQTFRGRKDGDLYLFSTKEAAEKWVEYNKPIYSKNDIEKLFNIKL